MTLLTHIWTNKLNVIGGDGRVTDKTLDNPVLTDDLRKIYPASNNFIAFHSSARINPSEDAPTMLKNLQSESSFSSAEEMSTALIEKLETQSSGLSTGLIYGGQFNHTEALYLKDNTITNDKQNMSHGIRFNSSSDEQQHRLIHHLDSAFKTITSHSVHEFNKYDLYDEDQYHKILQLFYAEVFKDPIANQEGGIGHKLDVGVINNNGFKWLQTETEILDI